VVSDNLVVGIGNALEKREALRCWVLGIRDLALERNRRARSARAGVLEYAPTGHGIALIRAELAAQLCECLRPLVLRGLLKELCAIICHRNVKAIRGDGLEVTA